MVNGAGIAVSLAQLEHVEVVFQRDAAENAVAGAINVSTGINAAVFHAVECAVANLLARAGLNVCAVDVAEQAKFGARDSPNFGNVHPGDGTPTCRVLDRKGNYLRTIIPYPANLPDERLKGLKRLRLPDGRTVPFVFQGETRSLYPGLGDLPRQRPVVTSDGRLVLVGIQEQVGDALRYAHAGPGYLTIVGVDGSVPAPLLGPQLSKMLSPSSAPSLALSPDEKTIYITGLRFGAYRGKATHAVYRCSLSDKTITPFIGQERTPGADETHLNDPRCLAVDAKGNIYVADRGNNRLAVFTSDGKPLARIPVEKPARVEVSRRTGAIYLIAGSPPNQLIKLSPLEKGAREVARLRLPNTIDGKRSHLWPVLALDDEAQPPVLWVGSPGHYLHFMLLRVEDKGAEFGKPVEVGSSRGLGRNMDIHVDTAREEVYACDGGRIVRFNLRTGKREDLRLPRPAGAYRAGRVAVGADNLIYAHFSGKKAGVYRFDRNLKPAPFPALGSNYLPVPGSLRLRPRGLTSDYRGNVYVLWQKPKDRQKKGDAGDADALAVFEPDGTLKNEFLIDSAIRSINSVRVDPAGNIYLAVGVRPFGMLLPKAFEGLNLGRPWRHGTNSNEVNWYPLMYGSIVRFSPEGGVIRSGIGGRKVMFGYSNVTEMKGAEWIYPEASVVPSWRTRGTPDVCLCESPCFDVDGFGRSFFPDALRFQAGVLDAAGNLICRFGSYGNPDSAGPTSAIPTPEIPILWLHGVGVSDEAVYLGDRIARRIVRVKLNYAVEERRNVNIK